jgi:type IV secretory pathway VirJ component
VLYLVDRVLKRLLPALAVAVVALPQSGAQQPQPPVAPDVSDLPLIELMARTTPGNTFAVMLTGDGGFAALDRGVSNELAAHGMPVVVLNTRPYLSRRRTPDGTGTDMVRVIRHYLAQWSMDKVAIVGYSRGADMVPFIISRLPPDLKQRVAIVAMLGLSNRVNFQFHFKDIFVESKRPSDVKTLPELQLSKGMNLLCIYGVDEKDSGCRDAPPGLMKEVVRNGGHHFDDDYKALGEIIIQSLAPATAGVGEKSLR